MFKIFKILTIISSKSMKFIGEDEYKNKYYESKNGERVCIYYKSVEITKTPPHWHAWLHHYSKTPIESTNGVKPHTPNTTGTKFAYFPHFSMKMSLLSSKIFKKIRYTAYQFNKS